MGMLTQKQLKSVLHYNPETGGFTWINGGKGKSANLVAGCIDVVGGYTIIKVNIKNHLAHRLAWLYMYGAWPKEQIDHIKHDRSDNRIENIREATHKENGKNQSINKTNTSGFNGVYLNKGTGMWYSQIKVNKKNLHLGYFKTKESAIKRRKLANVIYGYHANHGEKVCRH